jgi:hypothetical protein
VNEFLSIFANFGIVFNSLLRTMIITEMARERMEKESKPKIHRKVNSGA